MRWSRAARRASSSNWRSSLRTSRSPTRGERVVKSSPSRSMWRGKLPSSSPSRHTTRWGIDRMGTSVQTVRCPVQKFARVGLPLRRSVITERTSSQVRSTGLTTSSTVASPTSSSSSVVSWARCHASRGEVAVRESEMRASVSAQPLTSRVPPKRSSASCSRSRNSATRPASSMSLLSTSSRGSAPPKSRCRSSAIVTPRSTRSRPACQVLASRSASWNDRPVLGVEAPAHEGPVHPFLEAEQVLVAEAEAPSHRLAPGQVENLGGRDACGRQLEHLRQHPHHRIGLAQGAVGQPDLERT